jgi:hypothetical protein
MGLMQGTPPFMAIRLLIDAPPHLVAHDVSCLHWLFREYSSPRRQLHSLLFVLSLFYWSYPALLPHLPFPTLVPAQNRKWPSEVLRWANRLDGQSLSELGGLKRVFFHNPDILSNVFDRTLGDDNLWVQDAAYLRFFWTLYEVLWKATEEGDKWTDRFQVTPEEVYGMLRASYAAIVKGEE